MAPRRHQILVPDNVLGDGIFPLKFGGALLVKTVVCRGKDTFDLVSDNPAYSNGHVDLTKDGDHLSVVRESPPIGARFKRRDLKGDMPRLPGSDITND